jgi:dTDP-4-dehydrorhamnose reductase
MTRLPGSAERPVLVLGGAGLLGHACATLLRTDGVAVQTPGRGTIDLRHPRPTVEAVRELRPRLVINSAAFTDVTGAERPENRPRVFAINRDGAAAVARACAALGCALVHVSTDYVFDGAQRSPYTEDDPVGPLQTYGESKLAGEREVLAAMPSALIARTSTLFGPGRAGRLHYVDAILQQARARDLVEVAELPVSSPCYTPDVAAALLALARHRVSGVVHVVNAGQSSRLELARAVVEAAGLAERVHVGSRPESPGALRRPAYSALDGTRHASICGGPLRHWRDALEEHLRNIRSKEVGT